jgi:CDP-diacylglycerol--glycerol-3-phosphate 3-phosphatidyltransferase
MTAADQLTVLRIAVVPVVVLLFAVEFRHHEVWAASVFGAAMLTDQVDGWLARKSGGTDLGKILDPVADKILVIAVLVMLVGDPFPAWMVAAIVAREFLVSGLRLAAIERGIVVPARDLGKLKTWAQAVAAGLGGLAAGDVILDDAAWWALLVALAVTWLSGLDYARAAPTLLRGQQPA